MIQRHQFIKTIASVTAGLGISIPTIFGNEIEAIAINRPIISKCNFQSDAVEKTILRMKKIIREPELSLLFENCFPNTLDTTVKFSMKSENPDTMPKGQRIKYFRLELN